MIMAGSKSWRRARTVVLDMMQAQKEGHNELGKEWKSLARLCDCQMVKGRIGNPYLNIQTRAIQ